MALSVDSLGDSSTTHDDHTAESVREISLDEPAFFEVLARGHL